MINKIKRSFLSVVCFITCIHAQDNIELAISGAAQTQMPLAIIILDEAKTLDQIAQTIKNDFNFTGQFHTTIKKYDAALEKEELKKEIKKLFINGTPLALCINAPSKKTIEWRLYDTMQGTMIAGKKYKKKDQLNGVGLMQLQMKHGKHVLAMMVFFLPA